ncbi:Protein saf4, variant 2 [Batrachochytrium dendrobatidis]|nr:Protein saf4, variant 2 [Batrachochytrium dendrobatidis]KAK5665280.1 Protein saf4, variant 2 [Batrachochytrium dendrobatidis]
MSVGVRYNAEKKKVGMYYSTPIFSFRMKCHLCSGRIEIHTDPENTEYKIISGARRREESYDPEDIGLITLQDKETTEKIVNDSFYKLEHGVIDKDKAVAVAPRIVSLQDLSDQHWKDPYTASQKVRKRFRAEKKVRVADALDSRNIQLKHGFKFNILPPSNNDTIAAQDVNWSSQNIETHEQKQSRISSSSVFIKKSTKHEPTQQQYKKLQNSSADLIRAAISKDYKHSAFSISSTDATTSYGSKTHTDSKPIVACKIKDTTSQILDKSTMLALVSYDSSDSENASDCPV